MIIPKNLTKRIFKKAGAKRVSKQAQLKSAKLIEDFALKISKMAINNAEYFGRKTIKEEDL